MNMTRAGNVLHQKDPFGSQGSDDVFQDLSRISLIMDGVKSSDQVVLLAGVNSRHIFNLKVDV